MQPVQVLQLYPPSLNLDLKHASASGSRLVQAHLISHKAEHVPN